MDIIRTILINAVGTAWAGAAMSALNGGCPHLALATAALGGAHIAALLVHQTISGNSKN